MKKSSESAKVIPLNETAKVIPFKKRRSNKKLFAILGLTALVIFFTAMFTPWFNIKSIEVKGNSQIKQEEIINESGITVGQNIFRINVFSAKRNIKKNLYIDKVSISRNYPNKVAISVEERNKAGYFQFKGKNYIIDKNGMVLQEAANPNGLNAPVILGFRFDEFKLGKDLKPSDQDKEKYDLLLECFKQLSTNGFDGKLSKIDFINPANIVLWVYNDKYQVNMGDDKNFGHKLKFVKAIIDKQEQTKGPSGIITFSGDQKAIFNPR